MTPPYEHKKNPTKGKCCVRGCGKPRRQGKPSSLGVYCTMHHSRMWRFRNPARHAYNNLRHHATQRGHVFDITFEQFLQVTDLQKYLDGSGREKTCLSLDRVDPRRGYEPDNIQVITVGENAAKKHADFRRLKVMEKFV